MPVTTNAIAIKTYLPNLPSGDLKETNSILTSIDGRLKHGQVARLA